jgi:hypothetical protein
MQNPYLMIKLIIFILVLVSCAKIDPEPEFTGDYPPEKIAENAYYVAPPPLGDDRNPGTKEKPWATWNRAFNALQVRPGDTVYFRGGIYYHNYLDGGYGWRCTTNGTPENYVHFLNYPGETPILDCGEIKPAYTLNYPVYMRHLSYVHFRGLHIRNVWQADGEDEVTAWSINESHHIIVERCVVYNTHGLAFGCNGSNEILYLNCDSYNNCDSLTTVPASNPKPGNDGTGFSDFNWATTDTRNYYVNCRAWNCGDQGFTSGSIGYTEYDGCWSFGNGQLEGGGHGFKMGWVAEIDETIINRLYKNCLAVYNRRYGFDSNDQEYLCGALHLYNNTTYHNGYYNQGLVGAGFYVYRTQDTPEREMRRVYKNNLSYHNEYGDIILGKNAVYVHENNSWDNPPGITITDASFLSLDSTGLSGPRKPDGSLPDLDFLKLAPGSPAIDAGTRSTGLDYNGKAPDLGAYEY